MTLCDQMAFSTKVLYLAHTERRLLRLFAHKCPNQRRQPAGRNKEERSLISIRYLKTKFYLSEVEEIAQSKGVSHHEGEVESVGRIDKCELLTVNT